LCAMASPPSVRSFFTATVSFAKIPMCTSAKPPHSGRVSGRRANCSTNSDDGSCSLRCASLMRRWIAPRRRGWCSGMTCRYWKTTLACVIQHHRSESTIWIASNMVMARSPVRASTLLTPASTDAIWLSVSSNVASTGDTSESFADRRSQRSL
jgi:hypothetical protein